MSEQEWFKPGLDLSGKEKPHFKNDDYVKFTIPNLNGPVQTGTGYIVGLAMQSFIDSWIISIDKHPKCLGDYPWDCIVIPHQFISLL